MRAVIDSMNGAFIRCLLETGDMITINQSALPKEINLGDVLNIQFEIDKEATKRQRELMTGFKS